MKTHDLIESLVREAQPVRPLPGPGRLTAAYLGFSLAVLAVSAAAFGWRGDWRTELRVGEFYTADLLLLAVGAAAAFAAAALARPRAPRLGPVLAVAAGGVAAVVAVVLYRAAWPAPGNLWVRTGLGLFCGTGGILGTIIPVAAGVWVLRRGASVHPVATGLLLGLGSAALSALALSWVCDVNDPLHVLAGHLLLPGLVLGGAGAWAGRRWLKW